MRPQPIRIAALVLTGFAVTLIVLLGPRLADRGPPAVSAQDHPETAASRDALAPAQPEPAPAAAASAPVPAASTALTDRPLEPAPSLRDRLPVRFNAQQKYIDSPELAATAFNLSAEPLALSITVVHGKTESSSSFQISLPPHRMTDLTQAGLAVAHGDEVTLESPPFHKMVVLL